MEQNRTEHCKTLDELAGNLSSILALRASISADSPKTCTHIKINNNSNNNRNDDIKRDQVMLPEKQGQGRRPHSRSCLQEREAGPYVSV